MVKLFEQEENQSQLFFQKKLDEYKTLQNFCFMTKRMQNLYSHFNDIIVMDTTHKTNRFGMPLLDIIIINNMGQSCTVFIAFLKNQKYETFLWSLQQFKNGIDSQSPKIILTDEEEALRKGIISTDFYSLS